MTEPGETGRAAGAGILRHAMVTEAVNSVALEHAEDCRCTACRAADGGVEALADVYAALAESEREKQP